MEHQFTSNIKSILEKYFPEHSAEIFQLSPLIQYLNIKTKSASRGSKARGSFANLYAIYVLIEDYIEHGFHEKGDYTNFPGSTFKKLFKRQRELPFGAKLQNHALNNRLNSEFENWFPTLDFAPITRLKESERYWINDNLLKVMIGTNVYNLALPIIDIINDYIVTKQDSFSRFLASCEQLLILNKDDQAKIISFILSQLNYNVDARLFEIVSYAILKYYYHDQVIYWGFELDYDKLKKENLTLYKTGRTNANDGGIDFVMKPLGRFFQVTETLDFKKYFLDIEKLQKYPVTFVIKSEDDIDRLKAKIQNDALKNYPVKSIVEKYMACIEEIINIPELQSRFHQAINQGYLNEILNEIVIQSKVEFNYNDENIEDILQEDL